MTTLHKSRKLWITPFLSIALLTSFAVPVPSLASQNIVSCVESAVKESLPKVASRAEIEWRHARTLLEARKNGVAYPKVPTVDELSLVGRKPISGWNKQLPLSAGAGDPYLERARDLHVVEDYKPLSDLVPKNQRGPELEKIEAQLANLAHSRNIADVSRERALLKKYIETAYEHPSEMDSAADLVPARWKVDHPDPKIRAAFQYTEEMWAKFLKVPHPHPGGSLLPSPYPVLVPAGRFQESYYWDTYFAILGLLKTDRLDVAQMQVENFLSSIRRYGFIPNGGRDYYLSRSQPPFISSMVHDVYVASLANAKSDAEKAQLHRWLRERAYPLMKGDYQSFWMNKATRLDARTGLNHHWDEINLPRPERHGADNESTLGKTPRDVRAGAESGEDFTDGADGEATHVAGPLLNGMLYKTETDLAWAARELGYQDDAEKFAYAATRRKAAINRYLWNSKVGAYQPYNLRTRRHVNILSANAYTPLFVGAANRVQAARVRSTLRSLEKSGGFMASDHLRSIHQWDGTNGWAPYQVMAIQGLDRYGYKLDARRIARKWVDTLADVYDKHKAFYERVNVITQDRPSIDADKYPVQEGFLWTNGSFVWALTDVLKAPLTH